MRRRACVADGDDPRPRLRQLAQRALQLAHQPVVLESRDRVRRRRLDDAGLEPEQVVVLDRRGPAGDAHRGHRPPRPRAGRRGRAALLVAPVPRGVDRVVDDPQRRVLEGVGHLGRELAGGDVGAHPAGEPLEHGGDVEARGEQPRGEAEREQHRGEREEPSEGLDRGGDLPAGPGTLVHHDRDRPDQRRHEDGGEDAAAQRRRAAHAPHEQPGDGEEHERREHLAQRSHDVRDERRLRPGEHERVAGAGRTARVVRRRLEESRREQRGRDVEHGGDRDGGPEHHALGAARGAGRTGTRGAGRRSAARRPRPTRGRCCA